MPNTPPFDQLVEQTIQLFWKDSSKDVWEAAGQVLAQTSDEQLIDVILEQPEGWYLVQDETMRHPLPSAVYLAAIFGRPIEQPSDDNYKDVRERLLDREGELVNDELIDDIVQRAQGDQRLKEEDERRGTAKEAAEAASTS